LILVVLGSAACTEDDEELELVGVVQLNLADSDLRLQDLAGSFLQEVEFTTVTRADLTVAGRTLDLLAGSSCLMGDSVILLPFAGGKCDGGIAVNAEEDQTPSTLQITFTMKAFRAEPADLPMGGDFDMDGVVNENDICPLIADPGQEDADMSGFGDACEAINPFTGMLDADSDADGFTDDTDNCVHIANNQADSGLIDGIGDACNEQTADVTLAGNTTIDLTLDTGGFRLPELGTRFVLVNIPDQTALTCDFNAGTCTLDAAAIQACVVNDLVSASALGCN
jgi:hypothetical protein